MKEEGGESREQGGESREQGAKSRVKKVGLRKGTKRL
jgi:hypothetical protein